MSIIGTMVMADQELGGLIPKKRKELSIEEMLVQINLHALQENVVEVVNVK